MIRTICATILGACAWLALTTDLHAQLIDFELDPAGVLPLDDAPLTAAYNLTGGGTVQFFFDVDLDNTLGGGDVAAAFEEAVQDGSDGFVNSSTGINDDAAPGFAAQLGNFFLRQPVPGVEPPPFLIDYNTGQTITALSGEIWDIDGSPAQGTERWLVEVLNGLDVPVATQMSPLGFDLTMDSKPWTFAFSGLPAGVNKVRITFIGTKTQGIGLAFNNFRPTTAPEPEGLALLVLGGVGAWARGRRSARPR